MLGRAALVRILCDLAPGGVYLAGPVTRPAGGLLHHRFTLTHRPKPMGGLFSVALSRGSPRVGVTHHRALWSPDVPRHRLPGDATVRPTHPHQKCTGAQRSTRYPRVSSSPTNPRIPQFSRGASRSTTSRSSARSPSAGVTSSYIARTSSLFASTERPAKQTISTIRYESDLVGAINSPGSARRIR